MVLDKKAEKYFAALNLPQPERHFQTKYNNLALLPQKSASLIKTADISKVQQFFTNQQIF